MYTNTTICNTCAHVTHYFIMLATSSLYRPCCCIKTLCVPCSTTTPFSRTIIRSADWTVLSLWAIMTMVLLPLSVRNDSCIAASVSASKLDVASSRNISGESLRKHLAIDTRCFSPVYREYVYIQVCMYVYECMC